jgi:hypothetical protein
MRTHDLHGKRLTEAEEFFHQILGEIRMKRASEEVAFITGSGVIQGRIKDLATQEGLTAYVPMNNRGIIVVEFE